MKRVEVQASMLVGVTFFLFVALAPSRLNAQTANVATLTAPAYIANVFSMLSTDEA